jgi:hypothetical protein
VAESPHHRFKHDTVAVSKLITGGRGGAAQAIRGWYRQKRIKGAFQRQKNAKIWLNDFGVLEAWELWADHTGLDPVADMPPQVKELKNEIEAERPESSIGLTLEEEPNGRPTVTLILKGVDLKVIQQA